MVREKQKRRAATACSLGLLCVVMGCRGPALAEPGRAFEDKRTSLKGGTVSRRDAAEFDRYHEAALAGDREAQTLVALMLQTGQGVPRNEVASAHWFQQAAEAGECAAEYHLGLLYLQGQGVPVDIDRASYWLRLAADHRIAIQQSSFLALYRGFFGRDGMEARSTRVSEAATEARDAASADDFHQRGLAYREGREVPLDPAHAVRFFRMAANNGHAAAQHELGIAYRDGHGARQDAIRAHMWLNISAAAGNARARDELASLESRLSENEILRAEFLAAEWTARRK